MRVALNAAGRVTTARVAFAGVAATVARCVPAEAALMGQPLTPAAARAAGRAAAAALNPIDDVRASRAYRLQLVENLLARFLLDVAANEA